MTTVYSISNHLNYDICRQFQITRPRLSTPLHCSGGPDVWASARGTRHVADLLFTIAPTWSEVRSFARGHDVDFAPGPRQFGRISSASADTLMHARTCVSYIDSATCSWSCVGADKAGDSKSVSTLEHCDSEGDTFSEIFGR